MDSVKKNQEPIPNNNGSITIQEAEDQISMELGDPTVITKKVEDERQEVIEEKKEDILTKRLQTVPEGENSTLTQKEASKQNFSPNEEGNSENNEPTVPVVRNDEEKSEKTIREGGSEDEARELEAEVNKDGEEDAEVEEKEEEQDQVKEEPKEEEVVQIHLPENVEDHGVGNKFQTIQEVTNEETSKTKNQEFSIQKKSSKKSKKKKKNKKKKRKRSSQNSHRKEQSLSSREGYNPDQFQPESHIQTYKRKDLDYSTREEDPELLDELSDYTETWNSLDLRDKIVASFRKSLTKKKKKKKKKNFSIKKIPNSNPMAKNNSLPFLIKKSVNSFNTTHGKVPFHLKRKVNHDFNRLKETVEKQNVVQTSANFHTNLRLTLQEVGDLTKIKAKKAFTVENNLLYNTPQKLIKGQPDPNIPSFDCGSIPQNRKNLPVKEKSTRPIFLVRRPMSVKYNPERNEILVNGSVDGKLRNLRECDFWGLKGKIRGNDFGSLKSKLKPNSVYHQPKGRCLGFCEFYCGLTKNGTCSERCGAGNIGKKKSKNIRNHLPLKKPKKLIPKSMKKKIKSRVKSMSRKRTDFGPWGKLDSGKYSQYTGKRGVNILKKYEMIPPTRLISKRQLDSFKGLN